MSTTITGLPELLGRLAATQTDLLLAAAPALQEAVDELITVPSKDGVPVEFGVARDSMRTSAPVIAGDVVTVTATGGKDDDGDADGAPPDHAPSNQYIVGLHEDLGMNHPGGGGPKWLENAAMENGPRIIGAVAAKMRRR